MDSVEDYGISSSPLVSRQKMLQYESQNLTIHCQFIVRHMRIPRKKHLISLFGAVVIGIGAYFAIQYAKGYRPSRDGLTGTGLLAANSFPSGAEVYLNDRLTSATDDTINLPPGTYDVTIKKEGYVPWFKELVVNQELVTQTNASLFKAVPSLSPLTLSGAERLKPSPNGQMIAMSVASASAEAKNGLYVLSLSNSNIPLQRNPVQIAKMSDRVDFSTAELLWSPDSSQILIHIENDSYERNLLLSSTSLNDLDTLPDVTVRLPIIFSEWEEQLVDHETKQFATLPIEIQNLATSSAITNIYFSPSEEKILYTSNGYAKLPEGIVKAPPASSSQPEERELQSAGIYVYDMIEDKNFRVGSIDESKQIIKKELLIPSIYQQSVETVASISAVLPEVAPITYNRLQDPDDISMTMAAFASHYSPLSVLGYQWYPDSSHILVHETDRIDLFEYDATNRITLYAGPFENDFAYPWPDGSKLIISTNLNTNSNKPPNLYAVGVK